MLYTVPVNKVLSTGLYNMTVTRTLLACTIGALSLSACLFGGNKEITTSVVEDISGNVNPYLWRASLDTMNSLPLVSTDPLGGVIIYDWKSFPASPEERIKATVYILDSRLRADGVKVSVFRQIEDGGNWIDATVDPETGIQLENAILSRARTLKAAEIG